MNRSPRLPRARTRPSPGQLGMFDPALLTRATRRYPEAIRIVPASTGAPLVLLAGGAPRPAAPVVAIAARKAA